MPDSATTTSYRRAGFHTLTPYLIVPDAKALLGFLEAAFGAEIAQQSIGSAGGIHAEVRIGDSMLMIGGSADAMPTALHYYTEEVAAVYQKALDAGATSIGEPKTEEYGEHAGYVKDPAGNDWYIGERSSSKIVHPEMGTVTAYLHPVDAPRFMAFLKEAFAAEVLENYEHGGRVAHAKLRIGDSILELGEAHGPAQAMPTSFYYYVEDPDAAYRKALAAGCKPLWEPADQPYGERVGGVEDAWGNRWFPAKTLAKS